MTYSEKEFLEVEQNGLALQYASEELRKNPQIIDAAIKQNPAAAQYISKVSVLT